MRLLSIKSNMLGSTSWALEAVFCSATQMQKQNPYSDIPRNSAKVDLLLNSPLGPLLDTNPNVVPCHIRIVCTVSICMPKKLNFHRFLCLAK
jgi:hypothetical protein